MLDATSRADEENTREALKRLEKTRKGQKRLQKARRLDVFGLGVHLVF